MKIFPATPAASKGLTHSDICAVQCRRAEADRDGQRQIALISKLHNNLRSRPYDKTTLYKLIDMSYQQLDFISTIKLIKKAIALGEISASLYIRLGRCYYHQWVLDNDIDHLYLASKTYANAMKLPDFKRLYCEQPTHYFEMSSMLLYLGQHQAALTVLGIVTSSYRTSEHREWLHIAQYNIAIILHLTGNVKKAYELYQNLLLSELVVTIEPSRVAKGHAGGEAIEFLNRHTIIFPTRMVNIYLSLEVACMLQNSEKDALARALYSETFDRVKKYGTSSPDIVDFRFHHPDDFNAWYADWSIFKKLGDLFSSERNLATAAEMYGHAAHLLLQGSALGTVGDLKPTEKKVRDDVA